MKRYSPEALKPFFFKLTQLCFGELGLKDRKLVEYITSVLTSFSRTENLYRMKDVSGKQLKTLVEMLLTSPEPTSGEDRSSLFREMEVYQYIGDYTLFMTGIFNEYVEKIGCSGFYLYEGKKSYGKVADIRGKLYEADEMLFRELSCHFEFYTGALHFMKKRYFAREIASDPFENFLKQLEDRISESAGS